MSKESSQVGHIELGSLRFIVLSLLVFLMTSNALAQTNSALQFDGIDDFARVIDVGNFDFATTFTIESWVKPASVSGTGFAGLVSGRASDQPNSGGGWVTYLPNADHSQWGMSVCTPGCSAQTAITGSLVVDEWHHLAATYDGASIKIYQDGILVGETAHSGDVTDISHLFVGAWSGSFHGLMDEIRVWNIARTPEAILSTIFISLQGNEPGLVGYWPLDDGSGQFATDATGMGQQARLGATDGVDAQDPAWAVSDAPIIPPSFQLIPALGGLGTDIGISTVFGTAFFHCGWSPGETVEIWWDKPEAQLAVFTVDTKGCFEGIFALDDSERIAGSEAGTHQVQARGAHTGVVTAPFEQVEPKLHLNPSQGPSQREISVNGCGWDGASRVNVLWQQTSASLGMLDVNPGGCISGVLGIPRAKDGLYTLLAISNAGPATAAAYWAQGAMVILTPNEGPAGARVALAGCNWFSEELIDFAFINDGITFATAGTSLGGCITTGGPTEPSLLIPLDATLGTRTIRATGRDSGQVINTPFSVIERSLVFDPSSGFPGDPITVSGCGWAGNSQVTLEWGYPDTNNLPIRWATSVDTNTGCFGGAGGFTINVPANTITGPVLQTVSGNNFGSAEASFTVNHEGRIEILAPDGYAGGDKTVNVYDAVIGESIQFIWDNYLPFDGVGAATADFSYDISLPKIASVGSHTVKAVGTKGFSSQAAVNILDDSEISIITSGDVMPGAQIRVAGSGWAAAERVSFQLLKDSSDWPIVDTVTIAADHTNFSELISIPSSLSTGIYTLKATGNKGRTAEAIASLSVVEPFQPAFSLNASYADPAPYLDGALQSGEWNYNQKVSLSNGFISARSDETRLYILLDLLADTGNDALGDDNFWLTFDVWKNQKIDSGWDLNFRLDSSGDLILEEYQGPNHLSPRNSSLLRSAYASGFGCNFNDGSFSITFNGFIPKFVCDKHRVWEIGIDLATIGAQPGDMVRIGVKAISQTPAFSELLPAGFSSEFSELGVITLAPSQLDSSPPSGAVTGIGSNGFEIEATQAIQDATNSLKLVADKDTAVRVYPGVDSEALIRVFLFGVKDGRDLPGSPLVTLATVPPEIDRESLTDTANFSLPASWITDDTITLTSIVENLDGQNLHALSQSVTFYERRIPEIWVFPFNIGTAEAPSLPTNADMVAQEQVLEGLVPTPSVKFVHRPWTDIGLLEYKTRNEEGELVRFGTMKKALNNYWSMLSFTKYLTGDTSPMPDLLYGFIGASDPDAVGTSDPVYSGGNGRVVVGQADGRDFNTTTMIHEVNHNLDRSSTGTWGRHVANPANVEDRAWGCDAGGPDLSWPYTGNDGIQEVGFDTTTLPWDDGSGGHLTVLPTNRNDFMSYCWHDGTPIQWISPYRWQAMFSKFTPPPAPALIAEAAPAEPVYYISGQLNVADTGSLDPIQVLPGEVSTAILPGDYAIEIQDSAGTTLFEMPFMVSFIDVEGVSLDTVYFSFQLPAQPGAALILLKHNEEILDSIVPSLNPPEIAVILPTSGNIWSGQETIRWSAGDADGDPLQFTILYSPDEGLHWYPVASRLTENEYIVDVERLPGGTGGKIQLIVSDGFHTVQAVSNGTFTVLDPIPTAVINMPADGQSFMANKWISLSGSSRDVPGSTTDSDVYVWSVDGQIVDTEPEASILLEKGDYEISLAVYDGKGNQAVSSVNITVNGVPTKDDGLCFPIKASSGNLAIVCL